MGNSVQNFVKALDDNAKRQEQAIASLDERLKTLAAFGENFEKMLSGAASKMNSTARKSSGTSSKGSRQTIAGLSKEFEDFKKTVSAIGVDIQSLKQNYSSLTSSISSASTAVSTASNSNSNFDATLKQQVALLEEVAKAARTYNEVMTKAAEIAAKASSGSSGASIGTGSSSRSKLSEEEKFEKEYAQVRKKELADIDKRVYEITKRQAEEAAAQKRANDAKIAEEERFVREYAQVRKKELADIDKQIYEATKRQAEAYQAKMSTPQGALDYSSNAKTLNQQAQAIQYLKRARMSLDVTTDEGRKKLEQINNAIIRHKQALDAATAGTDRMRSAQSHLMDIGGQLQRQIALLFSVSQIEGYVKKIADVRGEFELQQRSLESLLQNKTEADELFNKTVQLAVKSPFTIRQLVSFNKQLAAYRIESDDLYDTMKRLADVSAGLGVDMQRIILAYGQVKAAAYLRGTEVRQFTEAGVNLYSELQSYYKETQGEAYTTAQIVDMISKRQVTFEDVEAVFKRLTDEGGLFYNMQETQSETLRGKIMNLQDSIDIMLNSIGEANDGVLKGAIDAAGTLLKNWEVVADAGKALAGVLLLLKLYSMQTGVAMKNVFSRNFASAATKNVSAMTMFGGALKTAYVAARTLGSNLKAAFVTNLPLLAITAVVGGIMKFKSWLDESREAVKEVTRAVGELRNELSGVVEKFDEADTVDEAKGQLYKLKEMYDKAGIKLKIDIEGIKEEDVEKEFDKLADGYEKYLKIKQAFDKAMTKAGNEAELGGLLGDNIKTDAEDMRGSYDKIIEESGEVYDAINLLYASYDKLSAAQRKALDGIRTKGEKEDDLDYLKRANKALRELGATVDGFKYMDPFYYENGQYSQGSLFKDFEKDAQEFGRELDKVFENFRKEYPWLNDKDFKVMFKAVLDARAVEEGWSEWQTRFAEEHFGIKVEIDKEATENNLQSLSAWLREYFDKQSYVINVGFKTSDLGSEDIGKSLYEKAQSYKKTVDAVDRVLHMLDGNISKDKGKDRMFNMNTLDISSDLWMELFGQKTEVSRTEAKDRLTKYKEANQKAYNDFNLPDKKADKAAAKQQRDILKERLELLKKLNSQYEELRKNMEGETKAASDVITNNREAIAHVGLNLADDFVPSKENVIAKLRELYPSIKDFNKKQDVWNTIGDYLKSIQLDEFNDKVDETKDKVEDLENAFELFKKLKDAGLSERVINSIMPGLPTSYEEVDKGVVAAYDNLRDKNGQLGEEQEKALQDKRRELREKSDKEIIDSVEKLVQDYGEKLSEQLQLDMWYYTKLSEIRAKHPNGEYIIKDDGVRQQMEQNLLKQYNEKTSSNTWKDFRETDSYARMFEDLDNISTKTLERLKAKVESLRGSLKDLSPADMKAMEEQIQKIEETIDSRNPLSALLANLREISRLKKEGKTEEFLNDEIIRLNEENAAYKEQIRLIQLAIQVKDGLVSPDNLSESDKAGISRYAGHSVPQLQKAKNNFQQKVDANNQQISQDEHKQANYDKARKNTEKTVAQWKQLRSQFDSLGTSVCSMLEAAGMDADGLASDFAQMGAQIGDLIIETITFSLQLKVAGIAAKEALGVIGYILIAVEAVVSVMTTLFGMHDKKLEKRIEALQDKVDDLSRAFDKLKESMDNAWSTSSLVDYKQQSVEAIDEEIAAYKQMIALEQKKKKTDKSKIKEYRQTIEDLQETKKELEESEIEAAGGFGSEENFKSAAQAFADAWIDAYNSSESGLDALQDKFDEYIENLIKKQAMLRIVGTMMEPLLKEIDDAVSEESEGGIVATQEELAKINKDAAALFSQIDENLSQLMNNLDYFGSSASNIENLQQGIENITAEQAAAIESYLNSIRFFVSNEQSDVTAILTILRFRFGESGVSASSQIISELTAQTSLLRTINENIDNAYRKGWKISNL